MKQVKRNPFERGGSMVPDKGAFDLPVPPSPYDTAAYDAQINALIRSGELATFEHLPLRTQPLFEKVDYGILKGILGRLNTEIAARKNAGTPACLEVDAKPDFRVTSLAPLEYEACPPGNGTLQVLNCLPVARLLIARDYAGANVFCILEIEKEALGFKMREVDQLDELALNLGHPPVTHSLAPLGVG